MISTETIGKNLFQFALSRNRTLDVSRGALSISPRCLTFITEHAAPAGLAEALPGPLAGPVHAARVRVALRTVGTRPAHLATAFARPTAVTTLVVAARSTHR